MKRVSVLTCCLPLLAAHLLTLLLHWMMFDGSVRLSEGASQGYGCLDLPEVDPNPEYGEWTVFVPCSRTITQTRTCCKILQREGQSVLVNCRGQDVDGGIGEWNPWMACRESIPQCKDGATRIRTRQCNNPTPKQCGKGCNAHEMVEVYNPNCTPVHGGWNDWSYFSPCRVTCGQGLKERNRMCTKPRRACGGRLCEGGQPIKPHQDVQEDIDVQKCSAPVACKCDAVDGQWSTWSAFSECTVSCFDTARGTQYRTRKCNSPAPQCGGAPCQGKDRQTLGCGFQPCCVPVNGGWSQWSAYTTCTVTCGGGVQKRSRKCNNPSPSCRGKSCPGPAESSQACSTNSCCDAARHGWTEWSSYGECSKTCGVGTQQKSRTCKAGSGTACSSLCKGGYTASLTCTVAAARDGGWSQWRTGACLSTCGSGVKQRTRTCTNPAPNQCGQPCPGPASDYQQCTGLPSCCDNYGKTGADISITPDEVTVTDDKTSATSIVQCKAITCGGDNLRELRVRYKLTENSAGKTEYAAAKWDSDGGRVVDKVGLSSTSVVGSIGVGFINYIFLKVRCEDAGYYECYTNIRGSGGKSQGNTKTKALTATVNPTRFTLTPVKFAGELKVGDVLKLQCSGSVGTLDDNSQVDIVWEYQDKDSSAWNKVQKPDVATITSASAGNCSAMTEARVLTLILTSDDRGRTYRCFLRKNGIDLNTQYSKFTVIINSILKPVANAFLSIQPNSVTLYSVSSPAVTVMCRAMRSQNPLTSLVVSHRAKHLNFTVQPKELAVTDTDSKVASVADLTITSVTGGLAKRLINYTIIQVLCDDDGVYFCTATTTLATTTRTDTAEKALEVKMEPYRSTLTPSVSGGVEVNTELKLQCSTLTNDSDQQEAVQWQWQYTADSNPKSALWMNMDTSVLRTIVTNRTITSHNCFNISTTTLTFEQVSRSDFGKYYRCYVIRGDTEYVQYAAVYKLRENRTELVLKVSGLAKLLGAIFGGVIGFVLIALLAYALWKRRKTEAAGVSGSHSVPRVVRTASVPLGMLPPPVAVLPQAQVIARPSVIEVVEEPSSFYSSSEVSSSVYDDDDASSVYSEAESSGYPVIVQTSRY